MAFNKRTHPDPPLEIAMNPNIKDNSRSDIYNSPLTPLENQTDNGSDLYHAINQKKLDRECYDLLFQDEGKKHQLSTNKDNC